MKKYYQTKGLKSKINIIKYFNIFINGERIQIPANRGKFNKNFNNSIINSHSVELIWIAETDILTELFLTGEDCLSNLNVETWFLPTTITNLTSSDSLESVDGTEFGRTVMVFLTTSPVIGLVIIMVWLEIKL